MKIHRNQFMSKPKPLPSEKHEQLQKVVRIAVLHKARVMRKAVTMVAARLEATAPPAVHNKGKGKAKTAPKKSKSSLSRQWKQAKKDTPPPTDFNENPHRRTKRSAGLPVCRVEEEYEGSQEAGIPVVDSRPGKKRSKAGRKRKDTRKGRPGRGALKENSRMDEPELINVTNCVVLVLEPLIIVW